MVLVTIRISGAGANIGWTTNVINSKEKKLLGLLKSVQIDGRSLYDIVVKTDKKDFPFRYTLLLNNRHISSLWELGIDIKNGDILTIFQPMAGG